MDQVEAIQFLGAIDTDSPNDVIPKGWIKSCYDIIWRGPMGNMRPESNPGTTLVPNSLLPATGTNFTIHAQYDAVNQRIFFFNFNSLGAHGIFVYNTRPSTFQVLIQNGVNTVGDVLGFTTTRISNVDILYGDGASGDLLFWIDSQKRPRKCNITRLLAGVTTPIKTVFLDVIKAPPVGPPKCVYENDPTVVNNNCINAIFNFACTHLYDDQEESVLGSGCRQPLPPDPFDPLSNIPQSRCSRIGIYVPTGDSNVKKIRIYAKQTKDGATTDWFIVDTLIKADLGIADNTVYKYLFYNNGIPLLVDTAFTVLDYDVVPQNAEAQTLLNGNVVAYAAITEGYDFANPSFQITTSNNNAPQFSINGTLFFGALNGLFTSGQPQIVLYLTGVGANDGFGNPTSLEKPPAFFFVKAKSGASDISFNYLNVGSVSSIPLLLSSISTAATSAGWVVDGTTSNSLTIHYPTGTITFEDAFLMGQGIGTSPYASSISASYPQSAYSYGVVQRDSGGRTNGVISNVSGNIKTQPFSDGLIPQVAIDMSGFVPFPWATYYEVVRTDTLTYNRHTDWVTAGAAQGNGQGNSNVYGYFDVSNFSVYNTSTNATEGVVQYGSFTSGDRVRVLGRYAADGTFTPLNLDYAILGLQTGPIINGQVKAGSFIQIAYPTNDINSDFQFSTDPNDTNYQNYKILIYSYKAITTADKTLYYQIGQQYGIGNQGTPSAYFMGNVGDNQVTITDGDVFYRQRTVPLVNSYTVGTGTYTQGSPYGTVWVNPGAEGVPVVDNGIWRIRGDFNKVAGLDNAHYPTYVDDNYTIKNTSASTTFSVRIRWTVNVTDVTDPNGQWQMYFKILSPANVVTLVNVLGLQTGLKVGVVNTYQIDSTFTMPPGYKMWLVNFAQNQMSVVGGPLTIDVLRNRQINVFDASFSDIYSLKTNSDNKPNEIDKTAQQTFFNTLFRFSEPNQLGTNINNSNRFYPTNFDEFDKRWGSVVRMIPWGKRLRIAQYRKWGEVGVYAKFIKNNSGTVDLIVNDTIIEPNNIQYFQEDFGVGNQPDGIAVNGFQIWFPDPVRGAFCRLSLDGIKNLSEEARFQAFAGGVLPSYLDSNPYQFGGDAKVLGAFYYVRDNESRVLFSLQGSTPNLTSQTVSFYEKKGAFGEVFNFAPDAIVCAENELYSFYGGQLYKHNNTSSGGYANYYGNLFKPNLEIVFNDQSLIKKNFIRMGYQSYLNKVWSALNMGDITTSLINSDSGLQQISQLLPVDFSVDESMVYAALLKDANSNANPTTGLLEGDYLKGNYLTMKLTAPDNDFNSLFLPFLIWNASPKNP